MNKVAAIIAVVAVLWVITAIVHGLRHGEAIQNRTDILRFGILLSPTAALTAASAVFAIFGG